MPLSYWLESATLDDDVPQTKPAYYMNISLPDSTFNYEPKKEAERELLTRLQETAVSVLLEHLNEESIDPAPVIVDMILRMETCQV